MFGSWVLLLGMWEEHGIIRTSMRARASFVQGPAVGIQVAVGVWVVYHTQSYLVRVVQIRKYL